MEKNQGLETEWQLLQNQYDSYEKYSLLIKLANTAVLVVAVLLNQVHITVCCLLLVLWGQDAIWKTFQARIESRLLVLEESLAGTGITQAYQFNRQYQNNRPGLVDLIKEYACQAVRPTIAYPHVVLLALAGAGVLG